MRILTVDQVVEALPPLRCDERLLVLAMTGRGKGWLVKALFARWLKEGAAIAMWDVEDEHSRFGNQDLRDVKLGPLRDRVTFDELDGDPSVLLRKDLSLAVVPTADPADDPEEVAAQFTRFMRLVRARGDLIVGVEEVNALDDGWTSYCEGVLNDAATRSRKQGVAMVVIGQFATQVPLPTRKQCRLVASGQQVDGADRRLLADRCGSAVATAVKHLEKGRFVLWDADEPDAEPEQKEEDDDG